MKKILSIQSHVAYGYVGNRAAVPPLQWLGFDVAAINTVQFSNHTGYGSWTGDILSPDHIRKLVGGLRDLGVLHTFDAVLSGYLGDGALGGIVLETVAEIRARNPKLVYCCDPVMGDVDRGLFVRPNIPPLFRDRAVALATILTPNLFELETLTGMTVKTVDDARKACAALHARGVETVLVTSMVHGGLKDAAIDMLASGADGRAFVTTTPRLSLDPMPNGSGDLTAALFLGHALNGCDIAEALARTTDDVFGVFEETKRSGGRELALIAARTALTGRPASAGGSHRFPAAEARS